MNKQSVHDAIEDALYLLNNELQCVIDPDLAEEYFRVIEKLGLALKEVPDNRTYDFQASPK